MFPQPKTTMLALLQRVRLANGVTQHFVFFTNDGYVQRANYLPADQVPLAATGDQIWFEVECTGTRPWPTWRGLGFGAPPTF